MSLKSSPFFRAEWLLLTGIFATNMGNAMHILVLGKWIFDLTGSAKAFGGALAFEQVMGFIIGLLAGPLVDRLSPARAVIWTDFFRGILVLICGGLTFAIPELGVLYLMILAIQMGKPFYKSGIFAAEIQLIPEERRAHYNSRTVTFMQAGSFVGMWMAGILISLSMTRWGFVLNGLSFFASAASLLLAEKFVGSTESASEAQVSTMEAHIQSKGLVQGFFAGFVRDWLEVIKILREKKEIAVAFLLNSFDMALPQVFNVLLVPLVALKLQNQPFWISGLDSAFAVGAGLSGLIAGSWIISKGIRFGAWAGLLMQSLGFVFISYFQQEVLIVVACFLFGFFNTISWSAWQTWLQKNVTKSERGKLSVVRHMSNSALTAIVVLIAGHLITIGVSETALFAAACAFVASSLTLLFFRFFESDRLFSSVKSVR